MKRKLGAMSTTGADRVNSMKTRRFRFDDVNAISSRSSGLDQVGSGVQTVVSGSSHIARFAFSAAAWFD
jgi:hypothetical protein